MAARVRKTLRQGHVRQARCETDVRRLLARTATDLDRLCQRRRDLLPKGVLQRIEQLGAQLEWPQLAWEVLARLP